jgi:hypothetical protein
MAWYSMRNNHNMGNYSLIVNCNVDDSPGLARTNMSAFWDEPWWRMLWPNKSLDAVITLTSSRMPNDLLRDRNTSRHQKVVDSNTKQIVGYAQWTLPKSLSKSWLQAQTADGRHEPREEVPHTRTICKCRLECSKGHG